MGGSKSSSNASTKTTTTTETKNVNATDFTGSAIVSEGDVTLTNGNAFELAAQATTEAINAVRISNEEALKGAKEFAEQNRVEIIDFANKTIASQTPIQNAIKWGTIAYIATKGIQIVGKKL